MISTSTIPILAVRGRFLLPQSIQTFDLRGAEADALVAVLLDADAPTIGVFESASAGLTEIGVLAHVLAVQTHAGGGYRLQLQGVSRVRRGDNPTTEAVPTARLHDIEVAPADPERAAQLRATAKQVVRARPSISPDADGLVDSFADDAVLADVLGGFLEAEPEELSRLVTTAPLDDRIPILLEIARRDLERTSRPPSEWFTQPWAMRDDGVDEVHRRREAGILTRDEADRLVEFAEQGYIVFERLIDDDLVDEVVADVRSVARYPEHFVTTNHRVGGAYRFSDAEFDAYESVFDTYVNFESARRLCFHPTILRFLTTLFDCRPLAFQQLLFQRSNAHPLHQDTAYVCVDEPLQLAATWIALEDVVEGRGELVYHERSHRLPPYQMADGSRRFRAGRDDPEAYVKTLQDQCDAAGCTRRTFLAKKGDVFLWAADLVHGSNERTRPLEETRMSCVTHYCPETATPHWFHDLANNRGVQPYGDHALIASSYYRLPKWDDGAWDGIVRPNFQLPPGAETRQS